MASIQQAKSNPGSLAENLKKVTISPEKISDFCQRNSIQRLSLFGSILRDDFNEQSDVDFLVEFLVGAMPGYFGLVAMENELAEMTGRKADPNLMKGVDAQEFVNELRDEWDEREEGLRSAL